MYIIIYKVNKLNLKTCMLSHVRIYFLKKSVYLIFRYLLNVLLLQISHNFLMKNKKE